MLRSLMSICLVAAIMAPTSALAGKPGGGNGSYVPGPPVINVDANCVVTFNGQVYVDKWGQLVELGNFRKKCAESELLEAQAAYLRSPEYRESQRDIKRSVGKAIEAGGEISVSIDEDEAGRTNLSYASGRAAGYREMAKVYAAMPKEAFATPGIGIGTGAGSNGQLYQRDYVAGAFANRSVGQFALMGGGGGVGPIVPTLQFEPRAASKTDVEQLRKQLAAEKARADAASKALAETIAD